MDKSTGNSNSNKLKILYLMRILLTYTDDTHGLTCMELRDKLEEYGITAERKSIYSDIHLLQEFGIDILQEQEGKQTLYHIGSREFELAELKLIVDLIQASKFLTEKKSNTLIKKMEGLTSIYEANQLQRQVYITGRVKAENEKIYYNVDLLHTAINSNVKVQFQYFQWNPQKEKELKHGGKIYHVSPYALLWDNENYYLIGYDDQYSKIRHYRVDKILNLALTEQARYIEDIVDNKDMAIYTKKVFSMFDGKEQTVRMQVASDFIGILFDRFGTDIETHPIDDRTVEAVINVVVNPHFLGWILALGDNVKIIEPESVVEDMRKLLKKGEDMYGGE